MDQPPSKNAGHKQAIVIYATVTGFLALIAAFFAFFSYDWGATGLCLGAAGLTFALLANAG